MSDYHVADLATINRGAVFALFEADGGAWMGTARLRIAAWLNDQLGDDGPVVLA